MKDHLTKLIVKARKQQNKDFKRLYKLATKTIRRLKEPKEVKQELINDLLECNNIDLVHFLGEIQPINKAEYIFLVDKFLELEYEYMNEEKHPYNYILAYKPKSEANIIPVKEKKCLVGGFKVLTEVIRKQHTALDSLNELRKKVGLKK
jgi:hypothetical protein